MRVLLVKMKLERFTQWFLQWRDLPWTVRLSGQMRHFSFYGSWVHTLANNQKGLICSFITVFAEWASKKNLYHQSVLLRQCSWTWRSFFSFSSSSTDWNLLQNFMIIYELDFEQFPIFKSAAAASTKKKFGVTRTMALEGRWTAFANGTQKQCS